MQPFRTRPRDSIVVDFGRGTIKLAASRSAGEAVRFRGITSISLNPDSVIATWQQLAK